MSVSAAVGITIMSFLMAMFKARNKPVSDCIIDGEYDFYIGGIVAAWIVVII